MLLKVLAFRKFYLSDDAVIKIMLKGRIVDW